jgi:hypothetical protein
VDDQVAKSNTSQAENAKKLSFAYHYELTAFGGAFCHREYQDLYIFFFSL